MLKGWTQTLLHSLTMKRRRPLARHSAAVAADAIAAGGGGVLAALPLLSWLHVQQQCCLLLFSWRLTAYCSCLCVRWHLYLTSVL